MEKITDTTGIRVQGSNLMIAFDPATIPAARFDLGQVSVTQAVLRLLVGPGPTPATLLARHVSGVWGKVSREDAEENEFAIANGGRIVSAYGDPAIWIITEADRSTTTILTPEEY